MEVDSEEQSNENGGITPNDYVTSDRKDDSSPIPPIAIINSPVHGPDTVDEIAGDSSNNNCANISSEIPNPMRDSISQTCEVPSNTAHTLGDSGDFNQTSDDPSDT